MAYLEGNYLEVYCEKAVTYLKIASDKGNSDSMFQYSMALYGIR